VALRGIVERGLGREYQVDDRVGFGEPACNVAPLITLRLLGMIAVVVDAGGAVRFRGIRIQRPGERLEAHLDLRQGIPSRLR